MRKIRLGIIGTGMAFERLHLPVLEKMQDQFEIVALANRSMEDAMRLAERLKIPMENVYEDYQKILQREDIEAIDIAVPIQENFRVSEDAARAGKHIFCEKPMAASMEEALRYRDFARKYQNKILIAENYRYSEEINKIRDIVSSGKIGEVVYYVQNNAFNFSKEMMKDTFAAKEWRQHPSYPGGTFLDGAIHDIAGMRHIFGSVECVSAFGKRQKEDFCPYVSMHTNIFFKNGVSGQYTYFPSGVEAQKPSIGLRIFGTYGNIYLEDKYCGVINIFYEDGRIEQVTFRPQQGYYNEFMNFYQCLNGREAISVTPEIEFGDVKMIFDILKSLSEREIIYVDEPIDKNFYQTESCADIPKYVQ